MNKFECAQGMIKEVKVIQGLLAHLDDKSTILAQDVT